tara:strand:+ start:1441 stop:2415 length:975 start_codon:yes stop_codon:yes gene_type:complete
VADTTNTEEENSGSIEDIAKSLLVTEETATQEEVQEETSEEPVQADNEEEQAVEEVASDNEEGQKDEEGQEQPEQQLYTVKVDGKEHQVPLEDLLRSYSGNSHIQAKMREQAEIRKQIQAEQEAISNQRKEYQTKLDEIAKNFQPQQLRRPPAELLQQDPIKYMMETEKYNIAKEDMEKLQAERQKLAIEQNEKAEQERLAYLQQQGEALVEYIPDLKDTAKAEGIKKEMIQTAVKYGFSESDISSIQDARALKLLHDVMLFNKAKATKNDKVQQSSPRPFIKAGAKQNPTAISSKQREKAFQNMKQSGSVEDVARWIATPEKR